MGKSEKELSRDIRELELIDRILGLEAEVARLSIESGIKDIRILKNSRAWQAGRIVLLPIVAIRKLFVR